MEKGLVGLRQVQLVSTKNNMSRSPCFSKSKLIALNEKLRNKSIPFLDSVSPIVSFQEISQEEAVCS